ncbi:putative Proteasome subunit alpha type-2-like 10 [Homarus americanus]|uniref:Putative Proteasome subunit alpha type-2-like 10 n=1 Tax=Homarus americanus TaxID=6706 RepID=A0A8J5JV58_HOMAM|nr:putative Proteasome subunit alpha type-2-like 10 [Homarus americanus]
MASLGYFLVMLAATMVNTATAVSQEVGGPVEQVGVLVGQVVEYHLTGCHLVLITTTKHSHIFTNIVRHLGVAAVVVVEAGWVLSQDQLTQDHLLQELWGDTRTTCRALILDLTANNSVDLVFRLLESSGLWQLSETRVLVVGENEGVEEVLFHRHLRNIVHAFYLALQNLTTASVSERVWVYRRCLYCNNGEADVQLIHKWNLTSLPYHTADLFFQEQFLNFMGLKIQFSILRYFPYTDYTPGSKEPDSTVTLKDCLDARLLSVLSRKLNFSIEVSEPPQRIWGSQENGKFSGMLGLLQREEADIGVPISPQAERMSVMKFISAYESDVLSIVDHTPEGMEPFLTYFDQTYVTGSHRRAR